MYLVFLIIQEHRKVNIFNGIRKNLKNIEDINIVKKDVCLYQVYDVKVVNEEVWVKVELDIVIDVDFWNLFLVFGKGY